MAYSPKKFMPEENTTGPVRTKPARNPLFSHPRTPGSFQAGKVMFKSFKKKGFP